MKEIGEDLTQKVKSLRTQPTKTKNVESELVVLPSIGGAGRGRFRVRGASAEEAGSSSISRAMKLSSGPSAAGLQRHFPLPPPISRSI